MLISSFLSGASYATGGAVSISGPTYIIPVASINTVLGSLPIGTGDAAERLLYGLLQSLYLKSQAGLVNQTTLGVEVSNKSVTSNVWENSANVFTSSMLANFLVSTNMGSVAITEDPTNLQIK